MDWRPLAVERIANIGKLEEDDFLAFETCVMCPISMNVLLHNLYVKAKKKEGPANKALKKMPHTANNWPSYMCTNYSQKWSIGSKLRTKLLSKLWSKYNQKYDQNYG